MKKEYISPEIKFIGALKDDYLALSLVSVLDGEGGWQDSSADDIFGEEE